MASAPPTAIPLTVMGGQAGILQGERRWLPLAGIYLGMGLGRIAFGSLAGLSLRSAKDGAAEAHFDTIHDSADTLARFLDGDRTPEPVCAACLAELDQKQEVA